MSPDGHRAGAIPASSIVVVDIAGAVARVYATADREPELVARGFRKELGQFERPLTDAGNRHETIMDLIGLGALFSESLGWSPADIVELWKARGFPIGEYKTISWRGPADCLVEVRP